MQKTAYDMRISDWSSDVCSSDLGMTVEDNLRMGAFPRAARAKFGQQLEFVYELSPRMRERRKQLAGTMSGGEPQMRSEERRGGKECVCTCRSRRSPYH